MPLRKESPAIHLKIKTYAVRRPSMEALWAAGEWRAVETPDDPYDLVEHETGDSYPAKTGHELLEQFIQWEPRHWKSFFFMSGDFDGCQVSLRMFLTWQRVIEMALAEPQSAWASGLDAIGVPRAFNDRLLRPIPVRFSYDGPERIGEFDCYTVLDEIIAAVYIAKMNDGEFRRCGNVKCSRPPFAIGLHGKEFCSEKCEHAAGQRRRRADKKSKADEISRKTQAKRDARKKREAAKGAFISDDSKKV